MKLESALAVVDQGRCQLLDDYPSLVVTEIPASSQVDSAQSELLWPSRITVNHRRLRSDILKDTQALSFIRVSRVDTSSLASSFRLRNISRGEQSCRSFDQFSTASSQIILPLWEIPSCAQGGVKRQVLFCSQSSIDYRSGAELPDSALSFGSLWATAALFFGWSISDSGSVCPVAFR